MNSMKSRAMLWLDRPKEKTALEDRLAPAVETYTRKYGNEPGVIFVRPDMLEASVETIGGMQVILYAKIPPQHVVLCIKKEDFFNTNVGT